MPRAKNRVASRARRKKIIQNAKGFFGRTKRTLRTAKQAVDRANQYAFAHRKRKKRDFRGLWLIKINAACRMNGLSYSKFIGGLKKARVELDRHILAYLAEHDAGTFSKLAVMAQGRA